MSNLQYDHSIDTIDPDEPTDIPNAWDVDVDENGPFITSSFDDQRITEEDLAFEERVEDWPQAKLDRWFDNYCDSHPDFNAALNGEI